MTKEQFIYFAIGYLFCIMIEKLTEIIERKKKK